MELKDLRVDQVISTLVADGAGSSSLDKTFRKTKMDGKSIQLLLANGPKPMTTIERSQNTARQLQDEKLALELVMVFAFEDTLSLSLYA